MSPFSLADPLEIELRKSSRIASSCPAERESTRPPSRRRGIVESVQWTLLESIAPSRVEEVGAGLGLLFRLGLSLHRIVGGAEVAFLDACYCRPFL